MEQNVTQLLLGMALPEAERREVELPRLSKLAGGKVIFKLKQVDYNRLADLLAGAPADLSEQIVLSGLVEPEMTETLIAHVGAKTAKGALKKLLNNGEMLELRQQVLAMSGFGLNAVREVQKK